MTTRLRFPSEETAIACMGALYDAELGWNGGSPDTVLDVIGPIDGAEGFHINLLGDFPEKAAPFEVFPLTPYREFA